ncbi:MAG: phosphatidylglycerophosphatase A [Sedimentisphaerales bacterium]|nr:phosphatidylglycerophosphatase A [Sedimentisphaerales bacterium]
MKRLLTSCFGLGRLPLAPGSWGSLPPAIAFGLVCYFGAKALPQFLVMLAFFIAGSVICLKFSDAAVAATGKADPNEVVADEVAGQAFTFMVLTFVENTDLTISQIVTIVTTGFFLFRLFDTIKPWPSYRLEELHGGLGILADDLMAGLYAGIAMAVSARVWILK